MTLKDQPHLCLGPEGAEFSGNFLRLSAVKEYLRNKPEVKEVHIVASNVFFIDADWIFNEGRMFIMAPNWYLVGSRSIVLSAIGQFYGVVGNFQGGGDYKVTVQVGTAMDARATLVRLGAAATEEEALKIGFKPFLDDSVRIEDFINSCAFQKQRTFLEGIAYQGNSLQRYELTNFLNSLDSDGRLQDQVKFCEVDQLRITPNWKDVFSKAIREYPNLQTVCIQGRCKDKNYKDVVKGSVKPTCEAPALSCGGQNTDNSETELSISILPWCTNIPIDLPEIELPGSICKIEL